MGLNTRRKFSDNDTVKAALEPCGLPFIIAYKARGIKSLIEKIIQCKKYIDNISILW